MSLPRESKATSRVHFYPLAAVELYLQRLIALDFIIPDPEFEALNQLDRNQRYNFPFRWGIDVFGEVGAEETERRAEEHAAKQREGA